VSRPTTVHVRPSRDAEAVIVCPTRLNFSQRGAVPAPRRLRADAP